MTNLARLDTGGMSTSRPHRKGRGQKGGPAWGRPEVTDNQESNGCRWKGRTLRLILTPGKRAMPTAPGVAART